MPTVTIDGIKVDSDTLAFDLIKQVGPGGNFVTAKHTRRFMRNEHYQPIISDRRDRADWEAKGSKDTWERASERTSELLAGHTWSLMSTVRQQILSEVDGIVN